MSVKVNSAPASNMDKATAAWGADLPRWIQLLASACDATSQRAAADRIGKSSGYVSRLVNRTYAGDYHEAETLVRSTWGGEDVHCPAWGTEIPLASCVSNRRRKTPASNHAHHLYDRVCPDCPNNLDREED